MSINANKVHSYDLKLEIIEPLIFSFTHSRIFNPADADDVAQECLAILHQKRKEYNSNKNFKAWSFRICSFQIKKYLTHHKRHSLKHKLYLEASKDLSCQIASFPLIEPIDFQRQMLLNEIVPLLSRREKSIIKLSLQGLSRKNIIKKLNITKNNYITHKSRAIAKAKKLIKNNSNKQTAL